MEQKIKINNTASRCTIDIEGTIGVSEESQFAESSSSIATYDRLREALDEIAAIETKEVVVNIRSVGGDVGDALLIYEALSALDAKVTTVCYGYTASAATVIAQAADKGCRHIASTALYLIHRSSITTAGNACEIEQQVELLRKTDERIAAVYASHNGGNAEQYLALMECNGGNGRWLTPDEALAEGLVDKVVEVAAERSTIRNIVGHIAAWLGLPQPAAKTVEEPVDMPNMRTQPNLQKSAIAFEEGQRAATATTVEPTEDSPIGIVEPSANDLAYMADVKALQRIRKGR